MVYVKLQPYIQTSLAPRANHKLSFKFFGPFKILEKIGVVAYKLQLPDSSTIHPVFHVSQLKQAVHLQHEVTPIIPDSLQMLQVPELVLHKRVVVRGVSSVQQGLIKWFGLPATLATWEDLEALQQRFPRAPSWGQAGFKGEGDVSTLAPTGAKATTETEEKSTSSAVKSGTRAQKPNSRVTGPEWL
ncbi:hypothetical protein QOZ80_6AG0532360 [Eleusine coracana subsp. coracana]|nr:hypothetical protein QOZ80_6AG0532360 [Eleusine coracana subsp. coracana]